MNFKNVPRNAHRLNNQVLCLPQYYCFPLVELAARDVQTLVLDFVHHVLLFLLVESVELGKAEHVIT